MSNEHNYIIFTDLDGTLLNHHSYDYQATLPLLEQLKRLGIPVILNSSKTLAELEVWQEKLGLQTPMIAENGGVILLLPTAENNKHLIGRPYQEICWLINEIRSESDWLFEGFNDWTAEEVMTQTGLSLDEASAAKQRDVTEPILWLDTDENLAVFKKLLSQSGLTLKKGGRFYHVMAEHDKADAMASICSLEQFNPKQNINTIALGDGENDLAMLKAADLPVVLPAASGRSLNVDNAYYAQSEAPFGWVEAIESILLNSK